MISFPNNDDQFTGIVHHYSEPLHFVAYRITKNKEAAQDIVQEAFLKLWQQQTKITPDNPGGWLYRVVSNLSYRHVKRTSTHFQKLHQLQSGKTIQYSDVEERLIRKENDALLMTVFNRLPPKQQEVYLLSREGGLRRNQIASALNLSPNTVKVHLSRALQFMREHIACVALFLLFFVFNNLFFTSSNTNATLRDLYRVKYNPDNDDRKNREPLPPVQYFMGYPGH